MKGYFVASLVSVFVDQVRDASQQMRGGLIILR